MAYRSNRRKFLQTTAAVGVGYWVAGGARAEESKSPNEKVGLACLGYGLKGGWDFEDAHKNGNLVAICETDKHRLASAAKRYPKAKPYVDYRKMLDEMDKSLDGVVVSTPDHSHAVISVAAMKMGKHCFCQKPLTRTIGEARLLAQIAREKKLCTQMGNQGTALASLRKAAALLRAKAFGKITEVHVWTARPNWPFPQGDEKPAPEPAPEWLDWDQWIGPAPMRPYAKCYHPMSWRGFWDFGTGALGDMACHTVNMPYMGLDLRNPTTVVATTSGHNKDAFPKWSKITFEFPANNWRDALKLYWYDGGKRPPEALFEGKPIDGQGSLVVGEKGKLYAPGDYCDTFQVIGKVDLPEVKIVESPGHFEEWIRAIKGGPAATSNFPDYAGGLAETILLGNLAVWPADKGEGKKIEWDAVNLKATNAPELDFLIHPKYRSPYSVAPYST